jgi:hypothetical protein
MSTGKLAKLALVVLGYLAVYTLAHRLLFDTFPDVDTQWLDQAWQLMGPSQS